MIEWRRVLLMELVGGGDELVAVVVVGTLVEEQRPHRTCRWQAELQQSTCFVSSSVEYYERLVASIVLFD